METLMFSALLLTAICLAESIVLLILAARQGKTEKPDEPEPVKTSEYEDYLEKLWQEGLNGIMSYGISNAMGKRQGGE